MIQLRTLQADLSRKGLASRLCLSYGESSPMPTLPMSLTHHTASLWGTGREAVAGIFGAVFFFLVVRMCVFPLARHLNVVQGALQNALQELLRGRAQPLRDLEPRVEAVQHLLKGTTTAATHTERDTDAEGGESVQW